MLQILVPVALLGLAVNAEPGQVIVFTFLLGTKRPRLNAFAFLAGWIASLAVCFLAARAVVHVTPNHLGPVGQAVIAIGEIGVAIALALFALHAWRHRDRPRSPDAPKYLKRLEGVGPRLSFVGGIYEQSWTVTVAAGMVVVHAQASAIDATIAGVVFGITSTLSLLACYLYFELRGERAVRELRTFENRITNVGPKVKTIAAAIASVAFLVVGGYGLTHR